mgnify:FL=1
MSASGTEECQNGQDLPVTVTAEIAPYDSYNSISGDPPSQVIFQYSSESDCNANMYYQFLVIFYYECGGNSFQNICQSDDVGNTTLIADSATTLTEIVYTDNNCDTILTEAVITVPNSCILSDTDDYYVSNGFVDYESMLVQGYSSSSNSNDNDDTYTVNKDEYIFMICCIFVAFFIGFGCTYCYFTCFKKQQDSDLETKLVSTV